MSDSKEERIVVQYHYTVWPDHGVPEYPTSLLQFVRKVMSINPENSGPIVVHCRWALIRVSTLLSDVCVVLCSAGVGRTGTFMALFAQVKRMKVENNFDIFGYVRGMRYKRNCMVQTEVSTIKLHTVQNLNFSIFFPAPSATVCVHPRCSTGGNRVWGD